VTLLSSCQKFGNPQRTASGVLLRIEQAEYVDSIVLTDPGQNLLWPWLRQIDCDKLTWHDKKCVGLVVVSYEELRFRRDRGDCNCALRL
jgi:hypothetical protein